jgi:putative salt-induced outer membrane protein
MKKYLRISLALLFVSTSSFAQRIPADSIFAKYYQATGGKALWDGIKTYTMKRSYSAASATPYTADVSVSVPEQSIYKSKTIMNRAFVYGVKSNEGWIKVPLGNRMDVKDLSQAEQTNMRFEIYENLAPFIDYQKRGFIATTVGTETLNGVSVNQVELQGNGIKYNLWFDAKSGLLVRQKDTHAGVETITDLSNYTKSASGLTYPAKLVEINSVDKKPVTITSTVTVNGAVSPELFKR